MGGTVLRRRWLGTSSADAIGIDCVHCWQGPDIKVPRRTNANPSLSRNPRNPSRGNRLPRNVSRITDIGRPHRRQSRRISEMRAVGATCALKSKLLARVGRFHRRAQRQLANLRRCATDAPKGSLRSGAGSPFSRVGRFASECVSFASHFHEFSEL